MSWYDELWAAAFDAPAEVAKAERKAALEGRELTEEERKEAADRGFNNGVAAAEEHAQRMGN